MKSVVNNSSAPLISVILPVYNGSKYIAEALESVRSQTESNFECIVINDGSTDDTLSKLNKFKEDQRFKIISRENKGLIASLNEGLDKARGKYIARMDADDICLPTRFQLQAELMEKNPEVGACGTFIKKIGTENSVGWNYIHDHAIKLMILVNKGIPIYHPTAFIRRSILSKYKIKYPKYKHAEDYGFWILVSKVSKIYNLPKVLLFYRIHDESISTANEKEQKQQRLQARSELLGNVRCWVILKPFIKLYLKMYKIILKVRYARVVDNDQYTLSDDL